jgi:Putative Actinobacterial Holin-X, holin superfamily III
MSAPADRLPAPDSRPRLADLTASLLGQCRALAVDYALLAVLDARSAAMRFGWLIAVGLIAAVLVSTAWLALVVAAVVALTGNGASWGVALGCAGAVNVVAAIALVLWMRARMHELPFAATLRQLRGDQPETRREADER